MTKYKLTDVDLNKHLSEQLGQLQRSAHAFDEGYKDEAKRMATILRVLLHTGRYPSLLKQLGRDQINFLDTAHPYDPRNLLATHGLVSIGMKDNEAFYSAKLDTGERVVSIPFTEWWSAIIFADKDGRTMSRSDIVLTGADQDGGAHVDHSIRADYASLSRNNSLGWVDGYGQPLLDPERVAIRQITHEVLKSLVPRYTRTLEDVQAAEKDPEISGGKLRFFPSKKYFMENTSDAPFNEGYKYAAVIVIDSITTGAVRVIVGGSASEALVTPGEHKLIVQAGPNQKRGVFGEFTDAVIDRVSIAIHQSV